MERPPAQVLEYLTELEATAEDIIADKQQILALDKRRQKTREALSSLQKDKTIEKSWMCVNNMFIKMPKDRVRTLLKRDYDHLELEINRLRNGLKVKVDKMRDLESKEKTHGFNLCPMTPQEMNALKDLM